MAEPFAKRRKLAPKIPESPTQTQCQAQSYAQGQLSPQTYSPPEPTVPERNEFEAFARHLQDAAMFIAKQGGQKLRYTDVSVLLLRWEEDISVEPDVRALDKVFRDRYGYRTEQWLIPTVPNPSIKLGVQMASFLDNARPDHLLIIYYAGFGYLGPDHQLFWACNTREDAAKLKWDGVRCLFEDAQPDILLLLDTCAVTDAPLAGSHGVKQAIAAYSPETVTRRSRARSFTADLIEVLHQLGTGRPFSAKRLHEELMVLKQQMPNGMPKSGVEGFKSPVFFNLTPLRDHAEVHLSPLKTTKMIQSWPRLAEDDEDQAEDMATAAAVDATSTEQRILVCTTFVGDASPDMTSFNQWLRGSPALASKIAVEGMFLGPPTMLLISMPPSVWNIVQHDKVCCFLGYVSSHNMTHLYERLVKSTAPNQATPKEVADGRILLEAREAAALIPSIARRKQDGRCPVAAVLTSAHPAIRRRSMDRIPLPHASPNYPCGPEVKQEVGHLAEMEQAAEQLEALKHVGHIGEESSSALDRRESLATNEGDVKNEGSNSSSEANDSRVDEATASGEGDKPQARRSLQKSLPKQETCCHHCSHAPFKDSSSLRKHIAAAHTRPFPCAFSFAGCTSTFGSKNEWKRHIASQHLCLTYYRCSECPQVTTEGKGNEFNRKDLFTQHLRRMHAPFAIKKAIVKGDSKLSLEWEAHVKVMQEKCKFVRRQPPQRTSCPKINCLSVFEGNGSWDDYTEHVGRHMEKGEAQRMGVDHLLAKWALDEGIIEQLGNREYKLIGLNGGTGAGSVIVRERERDANNPSFSSDAKEDDPGLATVAASVAELTQMVVDSPKQDSTTQTADA